ncbi:protein ALTERED PHOSPHATE STARVATION RESPONSE 1-like [Kryptolebias marmoratus]|uniref:protein ALTERED PHOSPHATE STARVATION RESPONSE 1-like n=1 Tax=Kryptolebias marmoratus TaxID=37003 RepID=UPI0018ACEEEF|nr:protein ALTERED PHOSPHATE STARVATION RESPONSE 1-like [Kryptolebias marmoratus]
MIAIKQARPAGSAGASFYLGLTPLHDLLGLMFSICLVSSTLFSYFCDITFSFILLCFTRFYSQSSVPKVKCRVKKNQIGEYATLSRLIKKGGKLDRRASLQTEDNFLRSALLFDSFIHWGSPLAPLHPLAAVWGGSDPDPDPPDPPTPAPRSLPPGSAFLHPEAPSAPSAPAPPPSLPPPRTGPSTPSTNRL